MAGRAAGERDNDSPPIYHLPSFVRHLDGVKGVSWANFVHDLTPILWAVDNDYPFENLIDEHVAWFDGHFRPPYFGDTFIQRAAAGKLPSVSWIDPSFADLRTGLMRIISPPSNDDHPPSDVTFGQALVLKIYDALASSPNWAKTLFVITYDEHGGFFDHVPPPLNPPDDNPAVFKRYGVRVPAIVVSPAGRQAQLLARSVRPHLDHQDDPAPLRPHRQHHPRHGQTRHQRKPPRQPPHRTTASTRGDARALPAARRHHRREPERHNPPTPHPRRQRPRRRRRPNPLTSNTTTSPSKPPSPNNSSSKHPRS